MKVFLCGLAAACLLFGVSIFPGSVYIVEANGQKMEVEHPDLWGDSAPSHSMNPSTSADAPNDPSGGSPEQKKGCGSSISLLAPTLFMVGATLYIFIKKE